MQFLPKEKQINIRQKRMAKSGNSKDCFYGNRTKGESNRHKTPTSMIIKKISEAHLT